MVCCGRWTLETTWPLISLDTEPEDLLCPLSRDAKGEVDCYVPDQAHLGSLTRSASKKATQYTRSGVVPGNWTVRIGKSKPEMQTRADSHPGWLKKVDPVRLA